MSPLSIRFVESEELVQPRSIRRTLGIVGSSPAYHFKISNNLYMAVLKSCFLTPYSYAKHRKTYLLMV